MNGKERKGRREKMKCNLPIRLIESKRRRVEQ